jgi:hypothetical protein
VLEIRHGEIRDCDLVTGRSRSTHCEPLTWLNFDTLSATAADGLALHLVGRGAKSALLRCLWFEGQTIKTLTRSGFGQFHRVEANLPVSVHLGDKVKRLHTHVTDRDVAASKRMLSMAIAT